MGKREVVQYSFIKSKDGKPHGTELLFNSGPQPTLLLGGVGSGKTLISCLKMIALLDQYPGSRGVIVRQIGKQLRRTTMATLFKLLPPAAYDEKRGGRRNDNEGFVQLCNGSELLFMPLDKSDSLNALKSLELNFGYVDQAEEISAEAWDTLDERIGRWSGATMRGGWPKNWPWRATNPDGSLGEPIPPEYLFATAYSPGYDHWLTSRFWSEGSEREKYRKLGYQVFYASTRDNNFLTERYVSKLLARGPEYVRRYVDALDWGANEGAIFTIDEQSVVEPTPELLGEIRRMMKLHRVYDHGEVSPAACVWFATDAYGNIFAYRDYRAIAPTVSQHRRNIFELSKGDWIGGEPKRYVTQLADPVIFGKTRGKGVNAVATWSIADEFADKRLSEPETAIFWRPAINDEEATIARLKEYLKVDPNHRNPITGQMGAPRFYMLKRTKDYPNGIHDLLTDMRSARRIRIGTRPDGSAMFSDERDPDVPDHNLDCARYFCVSRPPLGLRPELPPPPPGSIRLADYEKQCATIRMRRRREERMRGPRGTYGY